MNDLLPNLLRSISTTSGFAIFCIVIATAYASIWYIFLFEPEPKRKKTAGEEEGGEEQESGEGGGEKGEAKQKQKGAKKQPAEKQPA